MGETNHKIAHICVHVHGVVCILLMGVFNFGPRFSTFVSLCFYHGFALKFHRY